MVAPIPRDLPHTLETFLRQTASRFRDERWPSELATRLESLADQVCQPCVVAVVGRVKSGKSSFVNALLGQDLAKTGTAETTATINYFRYGEANPQRPVRCCWRNGQVTEEDRVFLDSLQANDEDALRRAANIQYLEYRLPNPYLERVTLVDTPGSGAVVEEHQSRLETFIGLRQELRQRHDSETRTLTGDADAVIYLIGPTARLDDKNFLEEFQQVTQGRSRAINAIGILAKIDQDDALMDRRESICRSLAHALQNELNTVLPVSSGIRRTLDRITEGDQAWLEELRFKLLTVPADVLNTMLMSDEVFLGMPESKCGISRDDRERLAANLPWTVFTTFARLCADPQLDEARILARLSSLAGFERVKEVVDRRFLRRGTFLRCYGVANRASTLFDQVRYEYLPRYRTEDYDRRNRRLRFESLVDKLEPDPVAAELREFLRSALGEQGQRAALIQDLELEFGRLYWELEQFNEDYEALLLTEERREEFSDAELEELRMILGLYGVEIRDRVPKNGLTVEHVQHRQRAWNALTWHQSSVRREVAARAINRYGMILDHLMGESANGWSISGPQ